MSVRRPGEWEQGLAAAYQSPEPRHQPKAFRDLTPAQKRQKIGGLRDQLAILETKDGGEPAKVIVLGLATPGTDRSRYESRLLCRDYYEGGLLIFTLQEISELQRTEWPITDARHPEYEAPTMIVKPLDLKRGKR